MTKSGQKWLKVVIPYAIIFVHHRRGLMFWGEHKHQIDAKNRLRIPAKLKAELGDKFIITKGPSGCLSAFPLKTMENMFEKLQNVPLSDIAAQRSVRMLFSSASEVENDEQGRFLLPQNLKEFAKIEKNVVITGVGTRIDIWSEDRWNEYNSYDNFDEVLEGLGKFGV